ncbi:MAG TPA: glycosyltransferase [Gemmatimonadales bacterium]|nr:glycosyltransferase [Gemmatimonadales bacterium]
MRILHLAKYYWPRSGGMERVVQGLAEGAAALGHEVEVVAVQSFAPAQEARRQRSAVTRAFSFAAFGSQEIAPGYIAAAWKRADIIHVHHPHPLADLASLLRAGRTPVVVTQHADARRGIYKRLARLVLRRASAIVVPSRAHIALSTELTGFEGKVEVIPFGIDERRWTFVPPPPPDSAPRAIFIGRLVRYKGVDILLRALERVPDLRLDIVGTGPEGPRLRTLAQALAVSDRVRWWGEYPDDDLPRRMADADFLVLPSVTVEEMFGLVVLEAMAAGRPVITTALPSGVREVNVPGTTGLEVPLRDVGALAQALETLSHDAALRHRLGQAGQRRVVEQFTQTQMAERHIALYTRILEGKPVGHSGKRRAVSG